MRGVYLAMRPATGIGSATVSAPFVASSRMPPAVPGAMPASGMVMPLDRGTVSVTAVCAASARELRFGVWGSGFRV